MQVAPDVQAILNCMSDPAILLSRDYRILLANDAYQAVYGDGSPLRRRHCYEVSHGYSVPCDLAGEDCPLRNALHTGQTSKVLHVHHTPRGQEYVNVETRPVRDDSGDIQFFVEVLRPSNIARTVAGSAALIGSAPAFQRMLNGVNRVAPTRTTVLLLGETGTGKELVAKTLHERSGQSGGPLVPVECTGLPQTLFESELFGHVKGAFTGATADKAGLVEAAAGGTLFLDEIGDVPLGEQVKLLRLLETRRFRRVGSTESRSADFRLICATNKNLPALVEQGHFREDLLYRLNVFEIHMPPLRERIADLPELTRSMLARVAPERQVSVSTAALASLEAYAFPGNVRELRNIVEHALLLCDGDEILPAHLPARCLTDVPATAASEAQIRTLRDVEEAYLRTALARSDLDRRQLAAALGISERALYRRISQLKTAGGG